MTDSIKKRSVVINGHRTAVSLEDTFWGELRRHAKAHKLHLTDLVATIDNARANERSLSSSCRIFVVEALISELVLVSARYADLHGELTALRAQVPPAIAAE